MTPPSGSAVEIGSGDLFESDVQTLAIAVNCVGVMGKGIALDAKLRHPELFGAYAELCASRALRIGHPAYVKRLLGKSFLLFPTKGHWREMSRLSDIESGLESLAERRAEWGIESLGFPALGCGAGGLLWRDVEPILRRWGERLGVRVLLFPPAPGLPSAKRR